MTNTKARKLTWALEDHLCLSCGGRILRSVRGAGMTPGGNPVFKCADYGKAAAASSPEALCWCGFSHRRNHHITPELSRAEGVGLNELLGGEPIGEDMDKERIRDEAEAFFEWPTHDKTHVTTTSMLIFAGVIAGMAAEEAARAEKAWRKDAEAVLEKMAGEGWITEALQAEGVSGIGKALLSLKREARGVLSPPNAD